MPFTTERTAEHQNIDSNEIHHRRGNSPENANERAEELSVNNPHSIVSFKNFLMLKQLRGE